MAEIANALGENSDAAEYGVSVLVMGFCYETVD